MFLWCFECVLISISPTFQGTGFCKAPGIVISKVNLLLEWNSLYPAMVVA